MHASPSARLRAASAPPPASPPRSAPKDRRPGNPGKKSSPRGSCHRNGDTELVAPLESPRSVTGPRPHAVVLARVTRNLDVDLAEALVRIRSRVISHRIRI